jgi:hypothetical protein
LAAAAFRFGAALRRAVVFLAFLAAEDFRALPRARDVLFFFDDARELLRAPAVRPPDDREVFREPPRPARFAFLAT